MNKEKQARYWYPYVHAAVLVPIIVRLSIRGLVLVSADAQIHVSSCNVGRIARHVWHARPHLIISRYLVISRRGLHAQASRARSLSCEKEWAFMSVCLCLYLHLVTISQAAENHSGVRMAHGHVRLNCVYHGKCSPPHKLLWLKISIQNVRARTLLSEILSTF